MIAEKLKKSILQAAIQGKLTQREPGDGTAAELLQQIAADKAKLIKEGKIKKEKPLPEITEEEKPFDLPEGWEWCRLGDLCEIQTGKLDANAQVVNGSYPFFTCGREVYKTNTYAFDCDAILLGGNNASGDFKMHRYNGKFDAYQRVYVISCICSRCNDYLYLSIIMYLTYLQNISIGTTTKYLKLGQIQSLVISLPPFNEQQRIVARVENLLFQVDSLSKDEKKLDALQSTMPERLKASLLQAAIQGKLTERLPGDGNAEDLLAEIAAEKQWLIKAKKIKKEKPLPEITEEEKPFELPDGWAWCRLGAICNYGTNESVSPDKLLKGRLLIDLEDIEKNTGKLINHKIYNGKNANSNKNLFYAGNVLYSKLRPYLNKVILADEDGYCTSEILPLDFGKHIYNKYAQILLMSPEFLNYANQCSYGVKMPRLGTKDARIFTCPIPPLAEQQRIVQRLEELLPLCEGILSGK